MNKWMMGLATTVIGAMSAIGMHFVTNWVDKVNGDHETLSRVNISTINADHDTLKQLWWKDQYLNGPLPAAPVAAPKPAAPVAER